jgi:all-trans-8'-apo-beta-carotenal 15,15'-oxygenase
MSVVAPINDLAPGLERCFLFDAVEASYEISGIFGTVPEWLRGTYYVNGPARFERGGTRYQHWLDGDGMVCALYFSDAGVRFASRFVDTPKLREEQAAGKPIYRTFGTAFPGDKLRRGLMLEPPVNVSVYHWANRLLAFGEQTLPYELDPATLATRGEFDFGGRLNEVSPFAAHPKFDPETGHLFSFGISYSARQPAVNLYEFDTAANLVRRSRVPVSLPHAVHDFGLSARHAVFFLSPLLMDFERFWREGASVMESLRWEPERGSRLLIIPRRSQRKTPGTSLASPGNAQSSEAFSIAAGSGYCLHLINCFEEGSLLTVDVLELDEPVYREYQPIPDLFSTVSRGRPVRYRVSLERREVVERVEMSYDRTPDFPSMDPTRSSRSYDEFWMLGISASGRTGRKFFDQLAHASWRQGDVHEIFQTPPGEYLAGEPVYVPHPKVPPNAQGEGIVIVQHIHAASDSAAFLLFDAHAIRNGPIARLPLRHRLHPGFHASFKGSDE